MKDWFLEGHFLPRFIQYDPAWQRLPESWKKVYRFLCENSYLTQRSPTRRYCEWTYEQIGDHVGLKKRQVGTIVRRLMEEKLIYRWYAGDSGANTDDRRPRPPRYELPASRGMINWWRRVRGAIKKRLRLRKEKRHGKKDSTGNPGTPPASPILRHAKTPSGALG